MNPLIIANTQIRRDVAGRYCLNDLHQASGGERRHQPANWLRLDQTAELIAEVKNPPQSEEGLLRCEEAPVTQVNDGLGNGTYAIKELVYAYAMWISAKFHLHVIRAYDALVTTQQAEAIPPLLSQPQHRADQLVSAGRIFSAALRTARGLRMPPARAMQAAFTCAKRNTGVDWESELDAADLLAAPDLLPAQQEKDDVAAFAAAWCEGALDIPAGPVLATDLFVLYQHWSIARGRRPLIIPRFVNQLTQTCGLRTARKRWRTQGIDRGIHSFVFPGVELRPPGELETDWLGECVAGYRSHQPMPA